MSYIPKYILKRMLPKDCVKAVGDGGVEITMVNVISPISIDEVPENVLDYVEVKIDDEPLPKDKMANIEIKFDDDVYTLNNAQDALGKTIPVGGKLTITVPEVGLKAGDKHKVDVTIKTDNPINIGVERKVH